MRRPSPRLLLVLVAVAAFVAALVLLPVKEWTIELVTAIRDAGPIAIVLFVLVYIASAMFALPGSILTLGAGFAYGPFWGTLLVSPASVLASVVAFLVAGKLGRGWVQRRMGSGTKLAAIDRAIARQGFKITALLRLSPIVPYSLLNYMLGLTSVRLRDYVLASALGMLPGTIVYVYLGSLVTSTTELGSKPQSGWATALYWGGLVSAVLVMVIVTRLARQALARELAEPGTRER